jgi:hypothetical protein
LDQNVDSQDLNSPVNQLKDNIWNLKPNSLWNSSQEDQTSYLSPDGFNFATKKDLDPFPQVMIQNKDIPQPNHSHNHLPLESNTHSEAQNPLVLQ